MNGNGDLNPLYLGDGSSSAPSQAFFYEQGTGIYHDTSSYPNTAFTIVKKGQKRMRIADDQTNIYGTVQIDNLIPGTGSDSITLATGSAVAPSLNFSGNTTSGLYYDTVGNNVSVTQNGTNVASFNSTTANIKGSSFQLNALTTGSLTTTASVITPSLGTNQIVTNGASQVQIGNDVNMFHQALTCGNITSDSISSGTNSISCGTLLPSNGILSSGGQIVNFPDSKSAPGYTWSTDTTTGLFFENKGIAGITCGGTIGATFTSSNTTLPAVTTGTLSCSNVVNSGSNLCSFDNNNSPAYSWSGDTHTGMFRNNTNSVGITCGGTTAALFTATTAVFPTVQSNNVTANGSIGCTSLIATGTLSCGTFSMTAGAISCSSVSSTGPITEPRYWIRLNRTAVQNINNTTDTSVSWDTLETAGGGSSNWGTVTLPLTQIVIPTAGLYLITYEAAWQSSILGLRESYIEINNGGTPGSTRRWAESLVAPSAAVTASSSPLIYKFAANDQVSMTIRQNTGGSLQFSGQGSGVQLSFIHIVRLSE